MDKKLWRFILPLLGPILSNFAYLTLAFLFMYMLFLSAFQLPYAVTINSVLIFSYFMYGFIIRVRRVPHGYTISLWRDYE